MYSYITEVVMRILNEKRVEENTVLLNMFGGGRVFKLFLIDIDNSFNF